MCWGCWVLIIFEQQHIHATDICLCLFSLAGFTYGLSQLLCMCNVNECYSAAFQGSYVTSAFLTMRFLKTFGKEMGSDVFITVQLGRYFKGNWSYIPYAGHRRRNRISVTFFLPTITKKSDYWLIRKQLKAVAVLNYTSLLPEALAKFFISLGC